MKFTCIIGSSITKLRLFFYKVSFIINTLFLPPCEMLCASHIKHFLKALELFMHAVIQLVTIQNDILAVHPSRGKKTSFIFLFGKTLQICCF